MRVDAQRTVRDTDPGMRRLFDMGPESVGQSCYEQIGLAGGRRLCPWCKLDQAIETRRPVSTVVDCGSAGLWRFTWRPVIENPEHIQVSETLERLSSIKDQDNPAPAEASDQPTPTDEVEHTEPTATRFDQLANASPDGTLLLDDELVVRWANPAAAALLGIERNDLLEKNLMAFETESRGLSNYIAEQVSRGRHFGMVDHVLTADPSRNVPVQSALRISYNKDTSVREIQVNFRHRVAPRRDNPQALLSGAALVTGAQDPEEVPELLVDWCIESMGVAAALYFRTSDEGRLEPVTYAGVPEAYFNLFTDLATGGEMAERAWQMVHCLHDDTPPEKFSRLGYTRLDAAPVVWNDRPRAVILTASRSGTTYDPAAPVLEQMAAIAGDTIERLSLSADAEPPVTPPPTPSARLADEPSFEDEVAAAEHDEDDSMLSELELSTPEEVDRSAGPGAATEAEPPAEPTRVEPPLLEEALQVERRLVRDTADNLYYMLDGLRELLMSTARSVEDNPTASGRLNLGCTRLGDALDALHMLSMLEDTSGQAETVDLGRLCRRVWSLLNESLLRIDVTLNCDVPPRAVNVVTRPTDLAGALVHIVEALAEKLSPGGTIELRLDAGQSRIDVVAEARSGDIAQVADPELLRGAAAAVGRCQGELSSRLEDQGTMVVSVQLGRHLQERVMQVLVVEDEPVLAGLFEESLRQSRYHCTGVLALEDAVARLSELDFDAVVVDIYRRPAQALSLINQVQNDRPEAAVVVTTLARDRDTLELAMALGVDDSFTRPGSPEDLAASLERALRRRRAGRLSQWAATEGRAPRPAGAPVEQESPGTPPEQAARDVQLNTVRQMGRTLQHEINNPLAGVIGHAELLINEMNPNDPVRRRLEMIIAQGERIRNVVQKLSRTRSPRVVIEPEGDSRFEV